MKSKDKIIVPKGHKQCSKCKSILPFDDFYNYKYIKDGKSSYCKSCTKQIQLDSMEKRELERLTKLREEKNRKILVQNSQEKEEDYTKTKVCTRCKKEKPLVEFHKDSRSKKSDGRAKVCGECKRAREKENALKRLEKRGY